MDKKWIFGTVCNIFKSLSFTVPRILVVTGYVGNGGYTKKTEVWPKPESQCALLDFPLEVSGAVGFWTAQGPMVCGGWRENKCFLYKNHQWMPSTTMGTARWFASALQSNPNQAIIIGGYDGNGNDLKSTEVKTSTGSEEGKDFPVTIKYHCSFKINSTHALVTGGVQDDSDSASTWFVDLATTTFTPGPTPCQRLAAHMPPTTAPPPGRRWRTSSSRSAIGRPRQGRGTYDGDGESTATCRGEKGGMGVSGFTFARRMGA